MPTQFSAGELGQVLSCERLTRICEHDLRHDLLSVTIVRDPDHLRVSNVGVSEKEFLDLSRVDVFATADEHVLDPASDCHVTILIHRSEVAGMHPAVLIDGFGGLLRVVPVTLRHRVTAGKHLAGFAPRYCLPVFVDDSHFQMWMDQPHSVYPLVQRRVLVRLHRHRRCLGHSVANGDFLHAANMAKYAAGEISAKALDQSVQTLGGNGLTTEYGLARMFSASRLGRIAPVSREMILNYVSQNMMGLPKSY